MISNFAIILLLHFLLKICLLLYIVVQSPYWRKPRKQLVLKTFFCEITGIHSLMHVDLIEESQLVFICLTRSSCLSYLCSESSRSKTSIVKGFISICTLFSHIYTLDIFHQTHKAILRTSSKVFKRSVIEINFCMRIIDFSGIQNLLSRLFFFEIQTPILPCDSLHF